MKKLVLLCLILGSFVSLAQEKEHKVIKEKKVLKTIHKITGDSAFMGVTLKEIEEGDDMTKVMILNVFEDSGADEAGLISNDLIVKINGKDIEDIEEIKAILKKHLPDQDVNIFIKRGEVGKDVTVKLGSPPEDLFFKHMDGHKNAFFIGEPHAYMGIHMKDVEGQLAEFFGVKAGVLVEKTEADSPASTAGLAAGDVIVSIGEIEIAKASDIIGLLSDKKAGNEITVKIVRRGENLSLPLVLGESNQQHSLIFSGDEEVSIKEWIDEDGEIKIEVRTVIEREE